MPREVTLITGASSGIGRELAHLFAADKSDLALTARSRDKLEALADTLRRDHGVEVLVMPADLTDPAAPQMLFDQLTERDVTVNVLVNNAGFGAVGRVSNLALDRQLDMVQVNVVALTRLTRLFLPEMVRRGRGGVLNVGSIAGFQPGPNMAVYYATKAFVLSFTEALAEELVGTGVVATCLAPGPTATQFGADSGMNESVFFRLGTMSAQTVARAGFLALRRGKSLAVPGLTNKLAAFSVRLLPRVAVRKLVKRFQGRP